MRNLNLTKEQVMETAGIKRSDQLSKIIGQLGLKMG